MKKLLVIAFLVACFVAPAPALTKKERASVQKVRELVVQAKQENASITIYAAEADRRAAEAESRNLWSWNESQRLSKEIEVAHKNEQELANWKKKYEPVIKQVNSWFGLGAIFYGVKKLAGNMLILGAILAVLALVVWLLSITFAPWLRPFIQMVGRFFGRIFDKFFRKKR